MPEPRAAIYVRISKDAQQQGLGVKRQEEDCRALAEVKGWSIAKVYKDNDVSASSNKARPQYAEMMQAVENGTINAIVVWDVDRLTRKPRELEDWIDHADRLGLDLASVGGDIDLATIQGRAMARMKGTFARMEVENTSRRLKRAFLQRSQRGEPQTGQRSFGWGGDKAALHPTEAVLLRKAIEDVIDGVPMREVVRQWNAAGVTTVRGNEWNHTAVRAVLRNPRLAGWKKHQGERVRDQNGELVRGKWEPMVDQETFDALQAALDGRQPKTRRGARRYLLSGVARCGECGSKMHGFRGANGGHTYACSSEEAGHSVTVAGRQTDDLIVALLAARLASEDLTSAAPAPVVWPGDARLAAIPGQIKELMAAYNAGTLSAAIVFPQVQALEGEQATLEDQRPASAPRPVKVDAADLPNLDVDRQRPVVEAMIEAVVVAKAERRGARWTPDRVQVVWA